MTILRFKRWGLLVLPQPGAGERRQCGRDNRCEARGGYGATFDCFPLWLSTVFAADFGLFWPILTQSQLEGPNDEDDDDDENDYEFPLKTDDSLITKPGDNDGEEEKQMSAVEKAVATLREAQANAFKYKVHHS